MHALLAQHSRRPYFVYLCLALCLLGLYSYLDHKSASPITGRRRFIALSQEDMVEIGELARDEVLKASQEQSEMLLTETDARYLRIRAVVDRLLWGLQKMHTVVVAEGGGGGGGAGGASGFAPVGITEWKLHVVDSQRVQALVTPSGDIFVYTGILELLKDDDSLAFVLGHEIAHVLLSHSAESISRMAFTSLARALVAFTVGSLTGFSFLELVLSTPAAELMTLPYSRQQESEADSVGLLISAHACYKPEGALLFFERADARRLAKVCEKMRDIVAREEETSSTTDSHTVAKEEETSSSTTDSQSVPAQQHLPPRALTEQEQKLQQLEEELQRKEDELRALIELQQERKKKQRLEDELLLKEEVDELFSTHPTDQHRLEAITTQLPAVLALQATHPWCPLCIPPRQDKVLPVPWFRRWWPF